MKKRSRRGAARISAIWMIVVVVLFFVSLGFAFITNDEATKAEAARVQARADATSAQADADARLLVAQNISNALGYYDRAVIGDLSNPQAASDGLQQLKDTIPDLGADVTDFERAVPLIVTAYGNRLREIQTLEARITQLEAEVDTARQTANTVAQQKDAALQQQRQEANDAASNWNDEKAALEQTIAERTADRNQKDADLKQEQAKYDDLQRQAEEAAQQATTRMAGLTKKLSAIVDEPEAVDGTIASVSEELNLGWIDLGAKDRVSRGMRFTVRSGNAAAPRVKGEAAVINVREAMAEVALVARDRFDPIVRGDVISNPLYSPDTVLNAVLVGRFSGTYNERELRVLLADIGVNVQDKLDLTTTHLIVGSELYVDEEGEPVEDPIQPSELPVYKDAIAQGVNIVSIEKLRHFFRK